MKKILSIIALVSIIIGTCNISFAKENLRETIISINISEDFKEWDKLSKEEKNKTIMPTATTINMNDKDTKMQILSCLECKISLQKRLFQANIY